MINYDRYKKIYYVGERHNKIIKKTNTKTKQSKSPYDDIFNEIFKDVENDFKMRLDAIDWSQVFN